MAGGGEHHPGEAQDHAADCALEGDDNGLYSEQGTNFNR
jgi:hypothetical protein